MMQWESMMKGITRTVLIVAALGPASCIHPENPLYCAGHPNDPTCLDGGIMPDASGCTSNTQCAAPTAVCEIATRTCVQCIAPDQTSACTGTSPVCGSDNMCHGCAAHSECMSGVCLPGGSCSDGSDVAYVDPAGTDNTACTKAMPCTKVVKALATSRPFVKLHGTTSEQVSITNQNVTLLADPGAKLTYTAGSGILLKIDGTSVVSIYDLELADALGVTGTGISLQNGNTATVTLQRVKVTGNGGGGVAASGGTLAISRSTISGNTGAGVSLSAGSITMSQSTISANTGAGVSVSTGTLSISQSTIVNNAAGGVSLSMTSFDIQNSVIAKNGGGSTLYGGVLINQLGSGAHTIAFNTIAQNVGQSGFATGVTCQLVSPAITFSNNIVYGNTSSQVAGPNCAYTYSDIGPDAASGTGNINADPMFVNATLSNFHITASSACKDAADPAATLNVDIDGDTRPQGTGRDIGADEVQ